MFLLGTFVGFLVGMLVVVVVSVLMFEGNDDPKNDLDDIKWNGDLKR